MVEHVGEVRIDFHLEKGAGMDRSAGSFVESGLEEGEVVFVVVAQALDGGGFISGGGLWFGAIEGIGGPCFVYWKAGLGVVIEIGEGPIGA